MEMLKNEVKTRSTGNLRSILLLITFILISVQVLVYGADQSVSPASSPIVDAVALRIGYVPVICGLPLYMAIEDSSFLDLNIKTTTVRYVTSDSLFADLAAGNIDLAFGGTAQALQMVDRYKFQNFNLIGVVHSSTCLIVSSRPNAPKSIEDLRNRKIGSFPGSIFHIYTREALFAEGIPRDSFEVIPIPVNDQIAALTDGRIDALYTAEPMGYIATHKGLANYLTSDDLFAKHFLNGSYFPGGCMLLSGEFTVSNPGSLEQIVKLLQKAERQTASPGFDMTSYIIKYTQMDESSIPLLKFKGCEFGNEINLSSLNLLVTRLKEWGLLNTALQLGDITGGSDGSN